MAITLARPTVTQRAQFGRETTYGTAVAATFRTAALTWKAQPKAESQKYNIQGQSFTNIVVPNREWSAATFEGPMTYGELPLLLQSVLATTVPVAGTSPVQTWTMV